MLGERGLPFFVGARVSPRLQRLAIWGMWPPAQRFKAWCLLVRTPASLGSMAESARRFFFRLGRGHLGLVDQEPTMRHIWDGKRSIGKQTPRAHQRWVDKTKYRIQRASDWIATITLRSRCFTCVLDNGDDCSDPCFTVGPPFCASVWGPMVMLNTRRHTVRATHRWLWTFPLHVP